MGAAFGELAYNADVRVVDGDIRFRSLQSRFNDCLAPDDALVPEFVVQHPDNCVAGLSLMFCLRRYFSPLDDGLQFSDRIGLDE